jgi:predicted nucleotidyltransferase
MGSPNKPLPPAAREALAALVGGVRGRFGNDVVAIRLFGSYARGDADVDSDVDVLVVLERAGWPERRAVLDLAADAGLEHDVLLSPTVLDRGTYERWRRQERPLVMDAERDGVPL